jgi:hypothetical protein
MSVGATSARWISCVAPTIWQVAISPLHIEFVPQTNVDAPTNVKPDAHDKVALELKKYWFVNEIAPFVRDKVGQITS